MSVVGKIFYRFLAMIFLIVAIFSATRGLIRALPGDPVDAIVAETGTALSKDALRKSFHLDEPFLLALRHDLERAVHGDLGASLITRQRIAPLIAQRFVKSLELTLLSAFLTALLSVPLGLAAAEPSSRVGRIADPVCSVYGSLMAAMPSPWTGPLLMIFFCVWIPVFPVGNHVLLPAIALSLSFAGFWSRLVRERVRETLQNGAAPGARARGIAEWKVLLKYGLAPCAGSLLAFMGTQLGGLMAGAFVVETIFDWPGMGDLMITAVLRRDYPVVENAVFVAAVLALAGNALGDWAQTWVDPRIRNG